MLARNILILIVSQVVISLLGFAGLILLSHSYGPSGLGVLALAISFVGLFQYVTKAGFNVAHLKRISEGFELSRGIGTYATIKLVLTALFVLTVLAVLNLTGFMGAELRRETMSKVVLGILAALAVRSMTDIATQTFAAERRTVAQMLPQLLAAVVRLSGIVAAVTFGWSLVQVSLVYFAAELGGCGLGAWLFRAYKAAWPRPHDLRRYISFALPMLVIGISATAELHVDKILLAYYQGSEAVGQYFGAQRMAAFLELVSTGIVTVYFPAVSKHLALGRGALAQELALGAERYSSIALTPVVIYTWLFAEPLMAILGDGFSQSAAALRYLTAAAVLTIVTLPFSEQIAAADRPKLKMWISVTMRVVQLLLLLVLVPGRLGPLKVLGLGVSGAALSRLLGRIGFFAAARVACRRLTETPLTPVILAHAAIGIGVAVLLRPAALLVSSGGSLPGVLLMAPITAGIFWLFLAGFRLLSWDDLRFCQRVVFGTVREDEAVPRSISQM